ncbi:hypothetical protein [Bacillus thuringiensis]|uniref:hypothetical protein n=1 Tax=Bacillus thuringiensis TaxID=1428 RepID=UPI000BF9FEEE|nr:hypothetical protein [Bacillus thuringiensis]PEV88436.1 hypothetical protein CN442_20785 [Bacillus thuringiensis]PFK91008.1 hypothetical protein COJ04_21680 [Bacillus thuringiensis]
MFAQYVEKKDSVVIEMPKAEFAAVGIASSPRLRDCSAVKNEHLGNPHAVWETIAPLYRKMNSEGKF